MTNHQITVIVITLGRDNLYKLVNRLLIQKTHCPYELILIPQFPLKEEVLQDERIKIYYKKPNLGFSHYRNVGIQNSRGDIIVFIDDDEEPTDEHWLDAITSPIITQEEVVTTSGYYIPLGQGYLPDSNSFLGFPGGGCVGFTTMWDVDQGGYTKHLCSGNFAITRSILEKLVGFDETLKHGAEDVDLGERLVSNDIKIKYVEQATVLHSARTGLINIINWNIRRGKSAYELEKKRQLRGRHLKGRVSSSVKILRRAIFTKYFPAVMLLMVMQYVLQSTGYLICRLNRINKVEYTIRDRIEGAEGD